ATPAELLMYPADGFVEDFVGADRALKRLALQRVRDIDLWKAAEARVGEDTGEVRRKLEDADLSIPLLVDENRHPRGWLSHRALQGERVEEQLRSPAEPVVEMDDILRDALSDLLASETRYAPVVDKDRRAAGVLSLEVIGRFLHTAPTEARTGADLVEEEPEEDPQLA
ncbi:MAG TPA: CBS domain-containing protein, partial [Thermoleophilaceae bacterium]|nr:CBS domain-containing protein [Thermoleophilaceae bacterium]